VVDKGSAERSAEMAESRRVSLVITASRFDRVLANWNNARLGDARGDPNVRWVTAFCLVCESPVGVVMVRCPREDLSGTMLCPQRHTHCPVARAATTAPFLVRRVAYDTPVGAFGGLVGLLDDM
jgi:hypothetical protein